MALVQQVERIEAAEGLDGAAAAVQRAVRTAIPPGPLQDALSGRWLGHPLHPVLMVVPLGAWLSASVLDVAGGPGSGPAADRLVGLGVVSALPTAASGASDWSETTGAERRVGFVHAVGNYAATAAMAASWLARRRGRRGVGVGLALAANAVLGVTGYLGGHLGYRLGVGVETDRPTPTVPGSPGSGGPPAGPALASPASS